MGKLLSEDDDRWAQFGFSRPIDGPMPARVKGVTLTPGLPGTLLVRSRRDDTQQVETWRCGDEYPIGLSAVSVPAPEVERREAQIDAWLAGLPNAVDAPPRGPDGATRERLRALGYLD